MSNEEAAELSSRIITLLSNDLLGEGNAHAEVDEDLPQNTFPAGNLGPSSRDVSRLDDFRITEYVPSSIGLLFKVKPGSKGKVEFHVSSNVYYPRMPNLREARQQASKYENGFPMNEAEWKDEKARWRSANLTAKFRPIFVRASVQSEAVIDLESIAIDDSYHEVATTPELDSILARISKDASIKSKLLVVSPKGSPPSELPGAALSSEDAFVRALDKYTSVSMPHWSSGLRYRAWKDAESGDTVVEVLLSNRVTETEARELAKRGQDVHLFNPYIKATGRTNVFSPFELTVLRSKNYRVNSTVYSSGINCDTKEESHKDAVVLETDILPIYRQMLRVPASIEGYSLGSPSPSELATDPIPHLKRVSSYLHGFSAWWRQGAYSELRDSGRVPAGVEPEFLSAQAEFEKEILRYDEGIQALEADPNLLKAFRLMNQSFAKNPGSTVRSWRVFQIVFIVSALPTLVRRAGGAAGTPVPIILWYPTGGGKTEAYLGLVIVLAFWGRLRGKLFGTSGWTKFPLRLLSIQQLSRIQAAMAFADLVRTETDEIPEALKGDRFSVGLYAGGSNSTNDLDFPNDASRTTTLSFDGKDLQSASPGSRIIQKNHKVDRCPMCRFKGQRTEGAIETTFDDKIPGFHHKCAQCGYELPLYVTDTETIRFLPTIIVSTVDKLAELGQDNAVKILFGYAKWKCPTHGYFMQSAGRCNVLKCGRELVNVESAIDPCPELVTQDEMHFLRETLGAFDSHYETAMLAIMRRARSELGNRHGGPWSIVGSSATIEGYKEQVEQLYCAPGAIRFPAPGPASAVDPYSKEGTEVQRFVMGFRPQNMSHVDAVMKVLLSFHKLTLRLADPKSAAWAEMGEPFISMNATSRAELIKHYRTSLAYALLKTEAGQIHKSFIGQLNQILAREGVPMFEEERIPNLTGEADAIEVANVLHRLERDSADWIQAVTATSIISHGVDLEVLNFLVFRGQPHTVSEWIQTMSRVGRKPGSPGIVVNVYNPNRERDAAYYSHHKKYIEHAETLIRNVPITRFSPEALRKTVRGLFYNILAFYSEPGLRYYYRDAVKNAMPKIKAFIRDTLLDYYSLTKPNPTPKEARLIETLDAELDNIIALLESPNQDESTKKTINPMISLRDVDEQILISPSYNSEFFRSK